MKPLRVFLSMLVLICLIVGCSAPNEPKIADRVTQVVVEPQPVMYEMVCDDVKAFLMQQADGSMFFTMAGGSDLGFPGKISSLKALGVKIIFVDGSSIKLKVKQDGACISNTTLRGFSLEDVKQVTTSVKEDFVGSAGNMSTWFFVVSLDRE